MVGPAQGLAVVGSECILGCILRDAYHFGKLSSKPVQNVLRLRQESIDRKRRDRKRSRFCPIGAQTWHKPFPSIPQHGK